MKKFFFQILSYTSIAFGEILFFFCQPLHRVITSLISSSSLKTFIDSWEQFGLFPLSRYSQI